MCVCVCVPTCLCVRRQVPISTLEHTVMKLYLEDFYAFCLSLPDDTAEVCVCGFVAAAMSACLWLWLCVCAWLNGLMCVLCAYLPAWIRSCGCVWVRVGACAPCPSR